MSNQYESILDARIDFIQGKVSALYCELRELEKLYLTKVDDS